MTSNDSEKDTIISSRPDLKYEGVLMGSAAVDPNAPNVAKVFRFFDTTNGTHFFTTNADERASIGGSRPDLIEEQSDLYEHATQQAGDVAVYRFFDTHDGSHFYTSSANEFTTISQTRLDMIAEGIAFYSP